MEPCVNISFLNDASATFTAAVMDADDNVVAEDDMMYCYLRREWAEYPTAECSYKDVSRTHVQRHLEKFFEKYDIKIDHNFCKDIENKCLMIETGVISADSL